MPYRQDTDTERTYGPVTTWYRDDRVDLLTPDGPHSAPFDQVEFLHHRGKRLDMLGPSSASYRPRLVTLTFDSTDTARRFIADYILEVEKARTREIDAIKVDLRGGISTKPQTLPTPSVGLILPENEGLTVFSFLLVLALVTMLTMAIA